jgi:protein arginine kinase
MGKDYANSAEMKKAQQALFKRNLRALEDRVCRAYGMLTNARIISSKEAIDLGFSMGTYDNQVCILLLGNPQDLISGVPFSHMGGDLHTMGLPCFLRCPNRLRNRSCPVDDIFCSFKH